MPSWPLPEHARLFERFLFPDGEASFDLFSIFGVLAREFQVASQFGLDFLDGGQAAAKFSGEGFGDLAGIPGEHGVFDLVLGAGAKIGDYFQGIR